MKHGPFEVLNSKEIYKNPWIKVQEDQVIWPDDKKGIFGVVEAKEGATILALTPDDQVYLVKEFHYAQNEYAYEAPSGGIDRGETPLKAAKRELKEETGLTAKKWTYLGFINPMTVFLRSPNHMFLAEELEEGEAAEEEKDLIELKKFPFKKVVKMIDDGEITHSATVVAVLKVAKLKGM
ncbi:MAG: hypothetical protein A2Y57_01000 [Candidatus Woykebacteria bacterium RBG_13_40_7b]|uniref:Nudix hydrolase domain-containing protein n=1 Tax=Candidatus Woykebacteria bacterium RBG_13_40_7b TaxID=1802594 RepID=A0A1G1WB13_9BACT|nr:MAG: hypothetical protein A2Y57_01000 [Candidatus Woykebacteria bacterium RBG_13_40_7b]